MLRNKIDVEVTERMFTVTLTETEVYTLIKRLKYKETFIPDLTEPVWKSLEKALGEEVKESID
jgi:hypothetical protein